jgi:dextranase
MNLLALAVLGPTMVTPGESFILRMDPPRMGSTMKIEMRHLEQVVKKWELTPGIRDIKIQVSVGEGKGYYFYIQEYDRNNQLIARSSKAIDASSDWTKFPRYGYVTRFDQDPKDARKTILKMAQQGVNIIQFYDWMNKHHAPLGSGSQWKDIANHTVRRDTILAMTDECRKLGIKSMAYNLAFGAYEDAFTHESKVQPGWQLFKDPDRKEPWVHALPSGWATPRLRLLDPANVDWQDFLNGQMAKAIRELGFDGWHIDQLGDHGDLFDSNGKPSRLDAKYPSFLNSARKAFPKRPLIFNNVAGYGLTETAKSSMDCIYIEAWDWYAKTYGDLSARIIEARKASDFKKQVVIAGYINSKYQEQFSGKKPGMFNDGAFESTLATILASGGWWLGPGDGGDWLGAEYFPNKNLELSPRSREVLRRYTVFGTAYQNLLRGNPRLVEARGWSDDVATLRFETNQTVVLHVLNFTGIGNKEWRDLDSTARVPSMIANPVVPLGFDQTATEVLSVKPSDIDLTPQSVKLVPTDNGFALPIDPKANWQMFYWRK